MKHLFVTIFLINILSQANAQIKSGNIEAHISNAVFSDAATGSYVETYLSVNPHTLFYKKQPDSTYKASLIVIIIFKKNGNEIVQFDKFQLNTVAYKNSTEIKNINSALIDLRRNALPKGNYTFITQIENENKKIELIDSTLKVDIKTTQFSFSDIELLDTFYQEKTKSIFQRGDISLIPMVMNYFPSLKNKLSFYTEIYPPSSAQKDRKFILQFAISKKETGKLLEEFSNSEVLEYADVIPVLQTLDISKLSSGNYNLNLQLLNRNNEIFATTSIPFQRFKALSRKSDNSTDTLYFNSEVDLNKVFVRLFSKEEIRTRLKTIFPIAAVNEGRYIDNLVAENNEEHMKRFYYNFWLRRNHTNPVAAFNEYEAELKIVNNSYGTSYKYGFETDRGRVRLQYGAPNTIQYSADGGNTGSPYEVWDYYALDNQTNIQFVFSPRDRASNEYEIVFTNKTGEKNYSWNSGNSTQSAMPIYDGVNQDAWGNTLGRDLNSPTGTSNTQGSGLNSIMNNPK